MQLIILILVSMTAALAAPTPLPSTTVVTTATPLESSTAAVRSTTAAPEVTSTASEESHHDDNDHINWVDVTKVDPASLPMHDVPLPESLEQAAALAFGGSAPKEALVMLRNGFVPAPVLLELLHELNPAVEETAVGAELVSWAAHIADWFHDHSAHSHGHQALLPPPPPPQPHGHDFFPADSAEDLPDYDSDEWEEEGDFEDEQPEDLGEYYHQGDSWDHSQDEQGDHVEGDDDFRAPWEDESWDEVDREDMDEFFDLLNEGPQEHQTSQSNSKSQEKATSQESLEAQD